MPDFKDCSGKTLKALTNRSGRPCQTATYRIDISHLASFDASSSRAFLMLIPMQKTYRGLEIKCVES